MPIIDFQAQSGSSLATCSSLKASLFNRRTYASRGSESFSDQLQRTLKNKPADQGETRSRAAASSNRAETENGQVKDATGDGSRNTEAPGGTDALTSDQESGQLEVKEESENNTDVEDSSAVQETDSDTSEPDGEVLGLIADMMTTLSQELDEMEASLKSALNGISSPGANSTGTEMPGWGDVDQILANIQDLENAIKQLSQSLVDESSGLLNNTAAEQVAANADQLKVMLNGGKLMIMEHFKGNRSDQHEGSGSGNDMLKVHMKLDSSALNTAATGDGGSSAGQESGSGQDPNQVKKIMMMENNKLNMLKIQTGDTEAAAGGSQPETVAPKTDSGTGMLLNNNLAKMDFKTADAFSSQSGGTVDTQDVVDQIVKKFELFTRNNASELKIQLKPEFLGKMTIKLSMEDGVLSARFVTDNQQVKGLLESNLAQFKQQLETAGIRVEKAEVAVQLGGGTEYGSMSDGSQQQWQFSQTGNSGNLFGGSEYAEGYAGYAGEEPAINEVNPLYDDISGDSSVSYII